MAAWQHVDMTPSHVRTKRLLSSGFSRRKEEAGHSHPHVLRLASLLSFFRCSLAAAASRRHLVFFSLFLFSSFSSWCAPLMLSCCPLCVIMSQLVLVLSSCCVRLCSCSFPSLILLSSVVLLWSFCCPAAVMLFTLLSEAGAGAAADHRHNNNSCRLSCLGSTLVQFKVHNQIRFEQCA